MLYFLRKITPYKYICLLILHMALAAKRPYWRSNLTSNALQWKTTPHIQLNNQPRCQLKSLGEKVNMSQDCADKNKVEEWETSLINIDEKHYTKNWAAHLLSKILNCTEMTYLDYTSSLLCKLKCFSCSVQGWCYAATTSAAEIVEVAFSQELKWQWTIRKHKSFNITSPD